MLEGPVSSVGIDRPDLQLVGWVYNYKTLRWSHRAALLQLQNERVLDTLGSAICLLRGKHRPIWYPIPGMDDVCVLTLLDNPAGLQTLELFRLARGLGF